MSVQASRQTDDAGGAAGAGLTVGRWTARFAIGLLLLLLLIDLTNAAHVVAFAVGYPYELDYGEGIVWQQMINIVAGHGYAAIGIFPAIVYHYPPIFHLASAGLAALAGIDPLAAGRLVSLTSTIVMMGLVAMLAACAVPSDDTRIVRVGVALLAGLMLAGCYPVVKWAAVMRVDMLQNALSLAGMLCAIRAAGRPRLIVPAAIAFVLAIYTKQTAVAAPAAAFVGLLVVRPRVALALAALCVALGATALGWLQWTTAGGFLRHTFLYNINRFDLSDWRPIAFQFGLLTGFILAAAIGAWATARRLLAGPGPGARIAADPTQTAALILLIFLVIKTAMLTAMLKSGSSNNYMIEWLCGVVIFASLALRPVLKSAFVHSQRLPVLTTLFLTIGLPLQAWAVPSAAARIALARSREAGLAQLVAQVRASPEHVVSDDMVLLLRAGKPVLWEPAIEAELAHRGLYDERGFAGLVRQHRLGFFITRGVRGEALYDSRYDPLVADAIENAYPHMQEIAGLTVHRQ